MGGSNDVFMKHAKQRYELKELERLGLSPGLEQRDLILAYLSRVLKENKAAELLPEGDEEHIFLRHFCDSLQPLLLFGFKKRGLVLDISSGGGFPSIPIRVFRPDLSFVLVEPNRKKAAFLEEVKAELALDNVEIRACKLEGFVPEKPVDYVVNRGTWTLQRFSQAAKPFLTKDGRMYAYKTKQFAAEMEAMTVNKDKDGVTICEIAQYSLGNLVGGLSLVSMGLV